jgi:hypothetical protein
MRAHQPGSTPIDIPETVPNPAYTPAPTPAPAPERAPTKVPEKVPEKVIAPDDSGAFSFGQWRATLRINRLIAPLTAATVAMLTLGSRLECVTHQVRKRIGRWSNKDG